MEILGTKTFTAMYDYPLLELQALKVCEEANELHQAVREIEKTDPIFWSKEDRVRRIEEEAADVLQATFNLLSMIGFESEQEVRGIMIDCLRRNQLRGRV